MTIGSKNDESLVHYKFSLFIVMLNRQLPFTLVTFEQFLYSKAKQALIIPTTKFCQCIYLHDDLH